MCADGRYPAAASTFVHQELRDILQRSLTRLPNLTSVSLHFSDSIVESVDIALEEDGGRDKDWNYRQYYNTYYRLPILLDVLYHAPAITSLTISNLQPGLHDVYTTEEFKKSLRRLTEFSLATVSLSDSLGQNDAREFWQELHHWLGAMPDLEWLSLRSDRAVPVPQLPRFAHLRSASFEGLVFISGELKQFFTSHRESLVEVELKCQLSVGEGGGGWPEIGWASVLTGVKGAVHESRLESVRCWSGLHYFSENSGLAIPPAEAERDAEALRELRVALSERSRAE